MLAIRVELHRDDLISRAGKRFASEEDSIRFVGNRRYPCRKVEIPSIVFGFRSFGERDQNIAKGLVGHLCQRPSHDAAANQLVSLFVFAFENQATRLWQGLEGIRVDRIIWPASPKRVLVQLQSFLVNSAK